ncbi:hypothetical protein SSAG_01540 [Streptomyces sp. Mg1]|nr:hypothetical protein SSAG_01540 [Streptomyces sp. Mg1]
MARGHFGASPGIVDGVAYGPARAPRPGGKPATALPHRTSRGGNCPPGGLSRGRMTEEDRVWGGGSRASVEQWNYGKTRGSTGMHDLARRGVRRARELSHI